MDVHQNAKLTPHCRELLVSRVLAGRRRREVAQIPGRHGAHRGQVGGAFSRRGRGRSTRSVLAHMRSPAATAEQLQLAVGGRVTERQRLTLATIAAQLALSRSSVARICPPGGSIAALAARSGAALPAL